ncbi:tyrosine-type recombinase/integrase [Streptomyces sp. NY05-11A]|uniref:tyrosine-type recombinase/integrase n=1 Tax=Streptomyces soliscabiei TaxID=588897 RepID=UPI0029B0F90D|nr:site-specific integrase [Streptomyces sp. NY05-11A]MDX2676178.1 site-specific integrase [Streptomyces sp. NY05-11A]
MAEVYDRWHLTRPRKGARPCAEHSSRTRNLVPSADHGTGKRWQVRYRDARGEQRAENFEKKSAADTRAAKIKADLDSGQFLDRAAGRQTFQALGEEWRTSAIHRDRTESRVERTLRLHLYPTFGPRAVAGIKRSEVQAWVKGQAQRYEATTVASHFEVLNTVMRTAVLDGAVRVNPCDGVTLPEIRRAVIVPHLLVVQALIKAAPARYRALVALAASSGLRQGELFGLEDGLDFLRRRVDVRHQLVTPDKGVQYLGQLKTPESYREVPLAQSAVTVVSLHVAQFPPAAVEIEDRTDPLKPRARAARLLFTDDNGRPIRRSTWSRVWKDIRGQAEAELKRAKAGVRVPDKCTLHSLRDFYATTLITKREDVKTVQVRLGHSKPSITLDKYVGYWPTDEDTTASVMESVLGPVLGLAEQVPEPSARVVHGATGTGPRTLR